MVIVGTLLSWATVVSYTASWKLGSLEIRTAATSANAPDDFFAVGWESITTIGGIEFPNWLVIAASLFVAGYALAERTPGTIVPSWLPALFGSFALLQVLLFASAIMLAKAGGIHRLHFGWWLAFLSTLVMLFSLLRKRKTPIPLKAPTPAEEV